MAGPGGAEVGRVSIRVVPDFTYFRRIMRAVLKEFDGKEVTVKVKADAAALNSLSKDLNSSVAKVSKGLSKDISNELSKTKAVVTPTINNKTRYKRRIEAQFNKLFNDVEVKLKYSGVNEQELRKYWDTQEAYARKMIAKIQSDMGDFDFIGESAQLDKLLNSLKQSAGRDFKTPNARPDYALMEKMVAVTDESAHAAREHNKVMRQWEQTFKDFNIRVSESYHNVSDLDRAFDGWSKGQTRMQLREIIYGFKELDGTVNQTASVTDRFRMRGGIIGGLVGGAGVIVGAKTALGRLGNMVKGLAETSTEAGKSLGKAFDPRNIGLNVSMGGFAAIAGLITLSLAPAIGLLTAGLLTIPGIMATFMAPIAAVTLGFKGIQKAAENAGLFQDKNGEKKGGGSLGAALKEIQKNTEDVFEKVLTEPFKKVGDVANTLIEPMKTVAQGAADVMKDIVNSITSEANVSRISETFKGVGRALSDSFGPGLAKFSDGLIGLAAEFTKPGGALEGLGKWFDDTMGDFKNWVNEGIKSGELTETFRQLGDALRIVLELAGDLAQKGLDFVSDPAKMQGFKDTLKEIADLLGKVMTLSRDLAPLWSALASGLGAVADPFSNLSKVIDNPGSLKNWNDLAKSLIPDGATGAEIARGWFNKDAMNQAAVEAGNSAAQQFNTTTAAVMAANKETQKAMLREAFTGEGITTAVQTQMTQQAQIAISGVQQALVPLKEGLQADINAALQPLGDIAGRVQSAFGDIPDQIQGSLGQLPGIVQQALGTLGTEAQTAMQALSDAVIEHCAIAVNTATAEAPRIAEPFKALSGQMGQVGADMMQGLANGIANSAGIASAAAATAAAQVLQAAKDAVHSKSPSKDFMVLGEDMNKGTAIGIQNSVEGPVSAIREVMQAIKDVFGSAEGINLNFFMGGAPQAMSSMAASSKEFRANMVEAGTSPALNPDATGAATANAADLADIKRQKAQIDLRIAELQAMKNATADKAAKAGLTAEIDQLRIQKERLDLLKEENGLQEERKTAIQQLSDTIATNITDMIKMPGEFAKTTANAAMQDLGISGTGAIPTIANWAMDAGTNFIFNVNNMDDAIQGQQAQQRKQVAGAISR